jgi:hypothetical protein
MILEKLLPHLSLEERAEVPGKTGDGGGEVTREDSAVLV